MAALLRANAAFRRLWVARTVSFLGDSMGLVALILYVADRTAAPVSVGLLLLATDLTPSLFSPLLGVVAGRFEARSVMVVCSIGQAIAFGAIVVVGPGVALTLVLVAAHALLAATFQAAARSAVPALVEDPQLETANALIGAGTNGLEALGPLVAAALLLAYTPLTVLAFDVASFVVAAFILLSLPRVPAPGSDATVLADAREGLRWMAGDRVVRIVTIGFVGVVVFLGVDDVALAFLGRTTLHAGDSGISVLYAAPGVGLLLGFVVLGGRAGRRAAPMIAVAGFALASTGNLLTGGAPILAIAVLTQSVRGVGASLVDVGTSTMVQRRTPPALRARVFANLSGAVGAAAGLSYVAGGALLQAWSPRTVFVLAGTGGLAVTLLVLASLTAVSRAE
jgi:MFS family permease